MTQKISRQKISWQVWYSMGDNIGSGKDEHGGTCTSCSGTGKIQNPNPDDDNPDVGCPDCENNKAKYIVVD